MDKKEFDKPWELNALGDLKEEEKIEFYEILSEDASDKALFMKDRKKMMRLFENKHLNAGILLDDGEIIPAEKYREAESLSDTHVDVYLERYFVHAMPGRQFDLQLAIGSRHKFEGRDRHDEISHTLGASGVRGNYVNYMTEPVFSNLKVSDRLTLDIAVTFISDRTTERFLSFLKGDTLKTGIRLTSLYNPVFGGLSAFVKGMLESVASFKKNQTITDARQTLMASPSRLQWPLVEGTYVFFQPSTEKEDVMVRNPRYDSDRGRIVLEDGDFERNYMFLTIKKHS
jgi:hypothetical protein